MIELNKVYNQCCLEGMQGIGSKSVNLIVIDPPYNIKKAAWDKWKTVNAYVEWMGKVFIECQRILKDNGSFYFFHNDFLQIVELQYWLKQKTDFVFKQLIVWNKKFKGSKNEGFLQGYNELEDLRNYQQMAEYCLYYTFQDETGLTTVMLDKKHFSSLRDYAKSLLINNNITLKQINEKLGHRKAEHFFYWGTTQWKLLTEAVYNELKDIIKIDRTYNSLMEEYECYRQQYEALRQEYEAQRYTFNNLKSHHSVWNYEIAPKIGHVTPKPIALIENIIEHSSNENDTVLDCFMGSGTTAIAAINTNRNYIGFEKEEKYYHIIQERIKKHTQQLKCIA